MKLGLAAAALFAALAAIDGTAYAEEKKPAPPVVKTSTVAAANGLTAEELELARYLDVLKELDMLEDFDLAQLLSVLEDEDER